MFSWGNKIVPLAETLGLNTLKHREARDHVVKTLSVSAYGTVVNSLMVCSSSSIEPEAKFNFADAEVQKKISGLNGTSEQERSRILLNVATKLRDEKLGAEIVDATLTVRWSIPIVTQIPSAASNVPVEAEEKSVAENKPNA